MAQAVFNKKTLFTRKLDLNLLKKLGSAKFRSQRCAVIKLEHFEK
jgi:hypothetical protein